MKNDEGYFESIKRLLIMLLIVLRLTNSTVLPTGMVTSGIPSS